MLICRCGELMMSNGEQFVCIRSGKDEHSGDRIPDVRLTVGKSVPVDAPINRPGRPYSRHAWRGKRCRLIRRRREKEELPGTVPMLVYRLFEKIARDKEQKNRRGSNVMHKVRGKVQATQLS